MKTDMPTTVAPVCSACARENRREAKFCRFCGVSLPAAASVPASPRFPEDYVGLEMIRKELDAFMQHRKFQREKQKRGLAGMERASIFVFRGDTGTGKSLVARSFANALSAEKLLETTKIVEKSGKDLGEALQNEADITKYLTEQRPGVIIVENATENAGFLHELLLSLSKSRESCICILLGRRESFAEFFTTKYEDQQRVSKFFDFPNPTNGELALILEKELVEKGYLVDPKMSEVFADYIAERQNDPRCDYRNAWLVEKDVIPTIEKMQEERLNTLPSPTDADFQTIIAEDVPLKNKRKTVDEILGELDNMVGLVEVKATVREIARTIEMQKERAERGLKEQQQAVHYVLAGNPGTGKTTVARKLGALFHAMRLLPSDRVIETDRAGLVAAYVGQTAPKVNELCDRARGGILFIDEAYTLNSDTFGKEAIDTLLVRMENDRGSYVVIAAGYEKEMEQFIASNPGLSSRFTKILHLADYEPQELCAIFRSLAKNNDYVLDDGAESALVEAVRDMYDNKGKDFANGRSMRKLFEETERAMAGRLAVLDKKVRTAAVHKTITAGDIPHREQHKEQSVDEILAELDKMIGLSEVKKAVREIANKIMVAEERATQTGAAKNDTAAHFVFTGNPGTGKTTLARRLAGLFKAMKLLPTDNLIETDRAGLVAGYVGQTAQRVNDLCDTAMGGILFIDEAYTLIQGGGDAFGKEAIDTLLKRMEDDRGKYVVIAAGYKDEMETFIRSNPGLSSRFTHFLSLADYAPEELYAIFAGMAKNAGYTLTPEAAVGIQKTITEIHQKRGKDFANGRTMRNLFEQTEGRQSNRLASLSREERASILNVIEAADIPPREAAQ